MVSPTAGESRFETWKIVRSLTKTCLNTGHIQQLASDKTSHQWKHRNWVTLVMLIYFSIPTVFRCIPYITV
ncbi:hypothetical protein B9Z55_026517 [Caenorhabditis nigoni]|uniref:Uncharacterized protein n=1 Tax=Caenorhabditis nigoni TaxID=1611254 RepID=A0A2G5T424_9PELO|nr:hypothetical protein B9Z55_026517 [Caenorhabditis nigoni]